MRSFKLNAFGESVAHMSYAATRCEEVKVTRSTMSGVENNETVVKSRKNERESSSYAAPDLEFAEAFGGGSEYFPFWRLPLSPFSWNRLFAQEEE
jgi:hypothetical protein